MLSAICFNVDQSKDLPSGNGLTAGSPAPAMKYVGISIPLIARYYFRKKHKALAYFYIFSV